MLGPGSSAAPGSPSEMPVPTEMPTSPASDSDLEDALVPTAPTRMEPTVLGGAQVIVEEDEVPVLGRSSGVSSSRESPTEVEIAVPTEKPTSPTSPMEDALPPFEVPNMPDAFRVAPDEPSAAISASAPPMDSPDALPVPTEMPSPATSVATIEEAPTVDETAGLARPELNFSSGVVGASSPAVLGSSPEMPVQES